jgi:DNA-binding NtrC family response regulator
MTAPRRVLVVDDDPAIRETISTNLGEWGYEVVAAGTAEQALSQLQSFGPALIITDIRMPGMSGLDLLATVKESGTDIDVAVITAFEDMPTAVAAMKAGALEYLVKPLDLDRIELTVQRCFRDRAARKRAARFDVLEAESAERYALADLVGRHPSMIEVYKTVGAVASSRAPVLILGETGTGKELVARAIHFNSPSAAEPFVAVNCTAIPESLLESELFGHVRGAFTGASTDRKGRFELAGSGTVFLDEIGDTTPAFQAKLLRVLQEREFQPVGAERTRRSEARVLAATHRDLDAAVAAGTMREDLYYRLRVVVIVVPPLRERRSDIPLLAAHILSRAAVEMHHPARTLAPSAIERLVSHDWPGNVRELENTLTRALLLTRGGTISADDLPIDRVRTAESQDANRDTPRDLRLRTLEAAHVRLVLRETLGNKRRAAKLLGVSRSRLDRLLEKHGIEASRSPGVEQ